MKNVGYFPCLFVFLLVGIVSCDSDKPRIKYEYYVTGEMFREVLYQNEKDTTSFTVSQYYKSGNLQTITLFHNGKRNGLYKSFYEDGKPMEVVGFSYGKKHGVVKLFNQKGKLKEESLYLNDKLILVKRFFENLDLHLLKMECYINEDSVLSRIGVIVYNLEIGSVMDKASFYYDVLGPDTLELGSKEDYLVRFYNKRDDFSFHLKIGEINDNLEFLDTSKIQEFNTLGDSIPYSFTPTILGNNTLLGMIYLKNDTVSINFPFYREYFVKE